MTDRWRDIAGLASRIPAGFTVGVATSAFQIEGATLEGGRGSSSWDAFMRQPGRILDGSSAAVACDHFHRFREDVALMRDLGVDAYRFSIAWPRVQPDGKGAINRLGVAFYDRLLDELLAAGIRPMATLYHWDTPDRLERSGGWRNRDTAYRFADYAYSVGEALGDRVDKWVTVNEPATLTLEGYAVGVHAPGETLLFEALPAAHHQLLGHGLAVQALRAANVTGGVGITNVHSPIEPASDAPEDALVAALFDILHNRIFADPVLLGRYPSVPDEFQRELRFLESVTADDLAVISAPLDFYGLNYYFPTRVRAGAPAAGATPDGYAPALRGLPFSFLPWPEFDRTGFGWPVAPSYLTVTLHELAERYPDVLPPVYITENGMSLPDTVAVDGSVDDPRRAEYLADHLAATLDGASGVDVRGYFVWSLMDNWEWAAGFTQRFGLVHVDFTSGERTPKTSYRWLQRLLASR